MVVQIETTFTNGLLLPAAREPYFLGDAGIDGYITLADQSDVNVDIVKISLEGLLRSSIISSEPLTELGVLVNTIRHLEWYTDIPTYVKRVQKLLEMTDVKRTTDFIQSLEQRQRRRKCFFHFEIPEFLESELRGQNSGYLRDLPASFPYTEPSKTSVVQQRSRQGECHIAYSLHAQAFFMGEMLISSLHPINIIPALGYRPPVCVADFPGEYALTKSRHLRGGLLGIRRTGDLRLEAVDPVSLVLRDVTDHAALSTFLKLTHRTYSPENSHGEEPMDVTECHCTGSLIATTFVSSIPRRTVPILQEVSNCPGLSRNFHMCGKTKVAVQFSKWRKAMYTRLDENNAAETWTQWETGASLTLQFQDLKYLVPTFDSSLVSRRYKLTLRIQIAKPHCTIFRLSLPVQVGYQKSEDRRSRRLPDIESPLYIA